MTAPTPDPALLARFIGPQGLPGVADDQTTAVLITASGSATQSALDARYNGTSQIVISPTAPPTPTVGTVWINNT